MPLKMFEDNKNGSISQLTFILSKNIAAMHLPQGTESSRLIEISPDYTGGPRVLYRQSSGIILAVLGYHTGGPRVYSSFMQLL